METTKHGSLIASQFLDVTIRVKAVRKYSVEQCANLLENASLFVGEQKATISEVLSAAAYICGEFCSSFENPRLILNSMLKPQVSALPTHIQAVFIHNILKLIAKLKPEQDEIISLKEKLSAFICSSDLEVQERCSSALAILECMLENPELAEDLHEAFEGELNPVAPKAQRKVPIPELLNLDQWIHEPSEEESFDTNDFDTNEIFCLDVNKVDDDQQSDEEEESSEKVDEYQEARRKELENNPNYLKPRKKSSKLLYDSYETVPIESINIPIALEISGSSIRKNSSGTKKVKKKKKTKTEVDVNDLISLETSEGTMAELMESEDEVESSKKTKKVDDEMTKEKKSKKGIENMNSLKTSITEIDGEGKETKSNKKLSKKSIPTAPETSGALSSKKVRRKKKIKKVESSDDEAPTVNNAIGEMPPGATLTDTEDECDKR